MGSSDRTIEIETPRLRLRSPGPGDAERLAGLLNEFDISRMTTRMPWPYGIEDARAFIERASAQDREVRNNFMIDHPDRGMIGGIGLFIEDGPPEIGYWIGREHWGQGYATEAARGVLAWGSAVWGKKVIVAGHFADNPASGAVLTKAGFLYTGEVVLQSSLARGAEVPSRRMVWLA